MSETIKGKGVVWSTGGITFTAGIVTSDDGQYVQSVRFSRTSEKTDIKDDGGTVKAQVFHGFKRTLSITVVPNGTTLQAAHNSMDDHCLPPGTTISVIDASGVNIGSGTLASPTARSYNLINATQNRTVDGVATIDLELEQGDEGVDLTTSVAAS